MRIKFLDGLRGLAILLVIGFHAFSRWPALLPYHDLYSNFPLFKLGWLGVQLFFLISGFVIFMTLDKTESFNSFLYKRWLRLFPAMLAASVILYFTSNIFYERPAGDPDILSLLPGLTFIEPKWWGVLLGRFITPLEGAFWSLYVEFKFYIFAGAIYYTFGRKYLVPSIFLVFCASIFVKILTKLLEFSIIQSVDNLFSALSFRHFGWFTAGAILYLYFQTKDNKQIIYSFLVAILSSISVINHFDVKVFTSAMMIFFLFSASFKLQSLQNLLQNRVLLFFGFISYPLYLIHENAMVSMIIKLPKYALWMPQFLYPLGPVLLLSMIAYLIASFYEPKFKKLISY